MKAINDFLSQHWVAVYGIFMYVLGCFVGTYRERRRAKDE